MHDKLQHFMDLVLGCIRPDNLILLGCIRPDNLILLGCIRPDNLILFLWLGYISGTPN